MYREYLICELIITLFVFVLQYIGVSNCASEFVYTSNIPQIKTPDPSGQVKRNVKWINPVVGKSLVFFKCAVLFNKLI